MSGADHSGFFVTGPLPVAEERALAQECAFVIARLALTAPEDAMKLGRFVDNLLARLELAEVAS